MLLCGSDFFFLFCFMFVTNSTIFMVWSRTLNFCLLLLVLFAPLKSSYNVYFLHLYSISKYNSVSLIHFHGRVCAYSRPSNPVIHITHFESLNFDDPELKSVVLPGTTILSCVSHSPNSNNYSEFYYLTHQLESANSPTAQESMKICLKRHFQEASCFFRTSP